jgi:chromosome segregation ATPase
MLKTYRIIPVVFILFLFGFTLITVSPVIAEDSAAFVECQQIKPRGKFRPMKQKKNCFRNLARALQDQSGDSVQAVVPVETSGSEVAELNVTIAALQSQVATLSGQHVELQSQVATLTTTNAQLQEPLNAKIAELETQLSVANVAQEPLNAKMVELEIQLSVANAAQEPLNAKMAELETQLSVANAAQEPLNAKMAELETQLSVANVAQEPLNAKVAELETQLSVANAAQEPLNAKVAELETQLSVANAAQEPLDAQNATPTVDYDEIMNSWNNNKSSCMGRMVQTIRQFDVGGRLTLSFMERRNTKYKGRTMLDECELSLD